MWRPILAIPSFLASQACLRETGYTPSRSAKGRRRVGSPRAGAPTRPSSPFSTIMSVVAWTPPVKDKAHSMGTGTGNPSCVCWAGPDRDALRATASSRTLSDSMRTIYSSSVPPATTGTRAIHVQRCSLLAKTVSGAAPNSATNDRTSSTVSAARSESSNIFRWRRLAPPA